MICNIWPFNRVTFCAWLSANISAIGTGVNSTVSFLEQGQILLLQHPLLHNGMCCFGDKNFRSLHCTYNGDVTNEQILDVLSIFFNAIISNVNTCVFANTVFAIESKVTKFYKRFVSSHQEGFSSGEMDTSSEREFGEPKSASWHSLKRKQTWERHESISSPQLWVKCQERNDNCYSKKLLMQYLLIKMLFF